MTQTATDYKYIDLDERPDLPKTNVSRTVRAQIG